MGRKPLSLRQTVIGGTGFGILLPALVLAFFQITDQLERKIALQVQAPMEQYAEVLSNGVASALWNIDESVALKQVEAVMRSPDVASVTIKNVYGEVFAQQHNAALAGDR